MNQEEEGDWLFDKGPTPELSFEVVSGGGMGLRGWHAYVTCPYARPPSWLPDGSTLCIV